MHSRALRLCQLGQADAGIRNEKQMNYGVQSTVQSLSLNPPSAEDEYYMVVHSASSAYTRGQRDASWTSVYKCRDQ